MEFWLSNQQKLLLGSMRFLPNHLLLVSLAPDVFTMPPARHHFATDVFRAVVNLLIIPFFDTMRRHACWLSNCPKIQFLML
jgi:hypothetical protein